VTNVNKSPGNIRRKTIIPRRNRCLLRFTPFDDYVKTVRRLAYVIIYIWSGINSVGTDLFHRDTVKSLIGYIIGNAICFKFGLFVQCLVVHHKDLLIINISKIFIIPALIFTDELTRKTEY